MAAYPLVGQPQHKVALVCTVANQIGACWWLKGKRIAKDEHTSTLESCVQFAKVLATPCTSAPAAAATSTVGAIIGSTVNFISHTVSTLTDYRSQHHYPLLF